MKLRNAHLLLPAAALWALAGCGSPKNDAVDYYGLNNPTPMKLTITISDQPGAKTGTQTVKPKETKDGSKVYSVERTGGIAVLGNQEMRLDEKGLHNIDSSIAKFGKEDLELPADMSVGATWKSHTELTPEGGQTIVNDSDLKVEGRENVKTEAGEHPALLVTSTGYSTMQGAKMKTTSKNWYVSGLGLVKSVMEITRPDGKVQTITIQETK